MRKIQLLVLVGCATFLNSCGDFDWEPRPYLGDHVAQSIVNSEGASVRTDQPIFDRFTCFDEQNIVELKTAIDSIKSDKKRGKALRIYAKHFPKH